MLDDRVAERAARTRAEVDDARRQAGFFHGLDELGRDGGRIARGLQDDGVAADHRRAGHAAHDGAREVPRRDDGADAQRDVPQMVALARKLYRGLDLGEPERLAAVELQEVDEFADVAVGLGPVLADFEHEPGHELELAVADDLGGLEEHRSAFFDRSAAPGLEGFEGGLHGRFHVLLVGFLEQADEFGWLGGVDRADLGLGHDALAAYNQRVLAPEFGPDLVEGGAHLPDIVLVAPVDRSVVLERPMRSKDFDLCGCLGGHASVLSWPIGTSLSRLHIDVVPLLT